MATSSWTVMHCGIARWKNILSSINSGTITPGKIKMFGWSQYGENRRSTTNKQFLILFSPSYLSFLKDCNENQVTSSEIITLLFKSKKKTFCFTPKKMVSTAPTKSNRKGHCTMVKGQDSVTISGWNVEMHHSIAIITDVSLLSETSHILKFKTRRNILWQMTIFLDKIWSILLFLMVKFPNHFFYIPKPATARVYLYT